MLRLRATYPRMTDSADSAAMASQSMGNHAPGTFLKRKGIIRSLQGRQVVQPTGISAAHVAPARIGFRCKIPAGTRASIVDFATDVAADGSLECNAAPWMIACATHVGASTEDRVGVGQGGRHPAPGFGVEFLRRENHRICGATGAATCTDSHCRSPRRRLQCAVQISQDFHASGILSKGVRFNQYAG